MRLSRKNLIILLIGYTLLLVYWMTLGFGRITYSYYMYNLIPFATIKQFIEVDNFNSKIWVINLIGNIGVFIPFGILIPLVYSIRLIKLIVISFVGLLVLETIQLITRKGSFDVDDFILNILGVILGYFFLKIIRVWANSKNKGIT